MQHHLTAAVVSNDVIFNNKVSPASCLSCSKRYAGLKLQSSMVRHHLFAVV